MSSGRGSLRVRKILEKVYFHVFHEIKESEGATAIYGILVDRLGSSFRSLGPMA